MSTINIDYVRSYREQRLLHKVIALTASKNQMLFRKISCTGYQLTARVQAQAHLLKQPPKNENQKLPC